MFLRRVLRFRRLEVVALRFRGAEFIRFRATGLVRLRCAVFLRLRLPFMARFAALRCALEPKCSFCLRDMFLRATFFLFLPALRFPNCGPGFAIRVRTEDSAIVHRPIKVLWNAVVEAPKRMCPPIPRCRSC
jgi:hypothetical protein